MEQSGWVTVELGDGKFNADEIVADDFQVIRLNGEVPQLFIQRLEKRLSTLYYLEEKVTFEFRSVLRSVKRHRDIVSHSIVVEIDIII